VFLFLVVFPDGLIQQVQVSKTQSRISINIIDIFFIIFYGALNMIFGFIPKFSSQVGQNLLPEPNF
jgi:hypothetical protein